jgi:hypothetical protein
MVVQLAQIERRQARIRHIRQKLAKSSAHTTENRPVPSVAEVRFRTPTNPVQTPNRTGSSVLVQQLAEPEPGVRFRVWPSQIHRTAFRRIQTRSNALFFVSFVQFLASFSQLISIFDASCDMINEHSRSRLSLQLTTSIIYRY